MRADVIVLPEPLADDGWVDQPSIRGLTCCADNIILSLPPAEQADSHGLRCYSYFCPMICLKIARSEA